MGNLAREGLRTLVVASKRLSQAVTKSQSYKVTKLRSCKLRVTQATSYKLQAQYDNFARAMQAAQLVRTNRAEGVRAVLEMRQEDMQLVCVTAVEDRLQANVRGTLEMLRDSNGHHQ